MIIAYINVDSIGNKTCLRHLGGKKKTICICSTMVPMDRHNVMVIYDSFLLFVSILGHVSIFFFSFIKYQQTSLSLSHTHSYINKMTTLDSSPPIVPPATTTTTTPTLTPALLTPEEIHQVVDQLVTQFLAMVENKYTTQQNTNANATGAPTVADQVIQWMEFVLMDALPFLMEAAEEAINYGPQRKAIVQSALMELVDRVLVPKGVFNDPMSRVRLQQFIQGPISIAIDVIVDATKGGVSINTPDAPPPGFWQRLFQKCCSSSH